jgi:hypothetical protein
MFHKQEGFIRGNQIRMVGGNFETCLANRLQIFKLAVNGDHRVDQSGDLLRFGKRRRDGFELICGRELKVADCRK